MESSKNKKIIFLIPTLADGGAERVASELSLNLSNDIERIIVLLDKKISYPYKGKLISLNSPASQNFFLKIIHFLQRFYRFKKLLKQENPDWVISFTEKANIINIITNKKSIISVHIFLSKICQGFYGKIYKILIKTLYNKTTKIITVSNGVRVDLIKNFNIKENKIETIYNSINLEKINQLAQEKINHLWFKNNIPVIITSGRLAKEKGQWHLIRTFAEIKKHYSCQLAILGQGELEQYLKKLVKDLNLEKDVLFLGWQKNPFKYLAKSDIFVLTSFFEGFGNVLTEAMACGLPIISSDCPCGPREILAPHTNINYQTKDIEYAEYGILTPVDDEKLYSANAPLTFEEKILSQAILALLKNKNLQDKYKQKSLERARDFDVKKIIKQWEKIIGNFSK